MKEIKEMTTDELINYFVEKKRKGASYSSIINIFKNNGIEGETKSIIMSKLDEFDKEQEKLIEQDENNGKKTGGFMSLLIGILIIIFGFILYRASAKAGVIFVFNFVVWGLGAILIFKGLLNIIAGFVKKS
ncbi:MAG: hypothetical protein N4A49_10925 [Marinifilaceae bacterium]|jgi:uncharacterized membrane protein (DUF106 family)|nr:hypothetical protein [Marinifilaceae bacterium]